MQLLIIIVLHRSAVVSMVSYTRCVAQSQSKFFLFQQSTAVRYYISSYSRVYQKRYFLTFLLLFSFPPSLGRTYRTKRITRTYQRNFLARVSIGCANVAIAQGSCTRGSYCIIYLFSPTRICRERRSSRAHVNNREIKVQILVQV